MILLGLLDHDDTLEPNALYEVAGKICEDDRVDVVYTDEDKINSKGTKHLTPNMKPDSYIWICFVPITISVICS